MSKRLIDADEYEKRIKPYDTEDIMDKALYNFAHNKLITTPSAQPEDICSECDAWNVYKNYAQPENIARDIATIIENEKDMRVMLQQRWIPFSERSPKDGQKILACSDDGVMWMTAYSQQNRLSGAWMPLPEPYKGEQE
ncbi:MAG: hypothetical protein IJI45_16605 [Anaerolineaceae bacterium]|nr:hypothetical protein [Anaerolineaceae bacterium]